MKQADKRVKCPVCGKLKLPRAIRPHIIQSAIKEVYQHYKWGNQKGVPEPDMLHQGYIDNHSSVQVKREIIL